MSRALRQHRLTIDFHTGYNWYEPGPPKTPRRRVPQETKGPRLAPAHAPISHVAASLNRLARRRGRRAARLRRARPCDHAVGATDDGDVQVGWVGDEREVPVFLGKTSTASAFFMTLWGTCAAAARPAAAPPLASISDPGVRLIRGVSTARSRRRAAPRHPARCGHAPPRQRAVPRGPRRDGGAAARRVHGLVPRAAPRAIDVTTVLCDLNRVLNADRT